MTYLLAMVAAWFPKASREDREVKERLIRTVLEQHAAIVRLGASRLGAVEAEPAAE